jgi:hypothetical protein
VYTQADVFTLRFIKRARELRFSIERIRRLLDLWQDKSRPSRDVKRLALDHITEIRAKIAVTTSMRDAVQELADACDGDERPECPILRDLEDAAAEPMPPIVLASARIASATAFQSGTCASVILSSVLRNASRPSTCPAMAAMIGMPDMPSSPIIIRIMPIIGIPPAPGVSPRPRIPAAGGASPG